jgi:hypothetical protein
MGKGGPSAAGVEALGGILLPDLAFFDSYPR